MVQINWGLLGNGNNALQMFDVGRKMGQDMRERRKEEERRGVLSDIYKAQYPGQLPGPGGGIGGGVIEQRELDAARDLYGKLADIDPEAAFRMQGQRAQQTRQAQEQRRADLPLITRLVETSTDEATYQRNRAVAQEYGIDTSTLPPQFDPAWRDQQLMTLKALQDPSKAEALSTAGKQAVDMGYKPGTPEFNKMVQDIWTAGESKPYVVGGETRLYTPKLGGQGQAVGSSALQPGHVEDGYRFKGGNPADHSSWEPVAQGGGGARVTSGFLDGI